MTHLAKNKAEIKQLLQASFQQKIELPQLPPPPRSPHSTAPLLPTYELPSSPFSAAPNEQHLQMKNAAKQIKERERRIHELEQYAWRAKREGEQRLRLEKQLEKEQKDHAELRCSHSELLALCEQQQAELAQLHAALALQDQRQIEHQEQLHSLQSTLQRTNARLATKEQQEQDSALRLSQLEQELNLERQNNILHTDELTSLYAQLSTLKKRYELLENENELAALLHEQTLSQLNELTTREQSLSLTIEQQQEQFSQVLAEGKTLQQAYAEALKENKNLQGRCFEALRENGLFSTALAKAGQERASLEQECHSLRHTLADYQNRQQLAMAELEQSLQEQQQQCAANERELHALTDQLTATLQSFQHIHQAHENQQISLEAKDKALKEMQALSIRVQGELADCLEEKTAIDTTLKHALLCLEEEKENSYKAQQHLAKKLKEIGALTEEVEAKQQQIEQGTVQNSLLHEQLQKHAEELAQQSLLWQQQHEEQQAQLLLDQQKLKQMEQQVLHWQNAFEKSLDEHKELKIIEQKYLKLMHFIQSIGLAAPTNASSPLDELPLHSSSSQPTPSWDELSAQLNNPSPQLAALALPIHSNAELFSRKALMQKPLSKASLFD